MSPPPTSANEEVSNVVLLSWAGICSIKASLQRAQAALFGFIVIDCSQTLGTVPMPISPKLSSVVPNWLKLVLRWPQVGPKLSQVHPKLAPNRPKLTPGWRH